jgi:hypothetical protein
MRVILEKADVIALLGKAMKRKLTEAEVEVHADPFEVVIHDATGVLGVDDDEELVYEEPVRVVKQHIITSLNPEDDDKTLEDLARESAALAAQPPKTGKGTKKLRRNLMPGESVEPRNPLEGGDDE